MVNLKITENMTPWSII